MPRSLKSPLSVVVLVLFGSAASFELGRRWTRDKHSQAASPQGSGARSSAIRATDELRLAEPGNRTAVPETDTQVPSDSSAQTAVRVTPPPDDSRLDSASAFHDPSFYVSSSDFNPSGKPFDRVQLKDLQAIIAGLNSEWRLLCLLEAREAESAAEAKIGIGDYRQVAMTDPVDPSPDAQVTHVVVTPSGGTRVVEIRAGEFAQIDDVRTRKTDLLVTGKEQIRAWIAAW